MKCGGETWELGLIMSGRTIAYVCCKNFRFYKKNLNLDQDLNLGPPDFQPGALHLRYPGSIEGTGLNLSLGSNAMQGIFGL